MKQSSQEIFDTVAEHLWKQMCAAVTRPEGLYDSCAYRADDGKKCAVGCLILDQEYTPAMEGLPVKALLRQGLLPQRLVGHILLLVELQLVHDHSARVSSGSCDLRVEFDPRQLDDSLSRVAETHGLLYARRSAAEGTAS